MVYSVLTGDARPIVDSHINMTSETDGYHGITYDPKDKKIYFSSKDTIYRTHPDGTSIEMALSSRKCKFRYAGAVSLTRKFMLFLGRQSHLRYSLRLDSGQFVWSQLGWTCVCMQSQGEGTHEVCRPSGRTRKAAWDNCTSE